MSSSSVDRAEVSRLADERCRSVHQRFPSLGTMGAIHRIAALMSLNQNGYIEDRPPDLDVNYSRPARISGAFEIFSSTKVRYPILFPTIVQIVAGRPLSLEEVYRQVSYHIHLGSILLKETADKADSLEDLYSLLLEMVPEGISHSQNDLLTGSSQEMSVKIGMNSVDNTEIHWPLTDTSIIENPHACIVGVSGQGKTQFALDILYQLHEQYPDVSLTVLDYKGDLSESDSSSRRLLESQLGCQVVTAGAEPIPTVPFQNTTSHDPAQYALGVADLLGKFYPRLGTQQRHALRQCLTELISTPKYSNGFGFPILENRIREYYDENRRRDDGLTEVLSRLSVLRAFEDMPSANNPAPLITGSLLVRLNELVADTLPVAFLIVSRLYDEMKQLPDVERQGSITSLRHIIFIDEAHHYLSVKSSPLARIIREGRSKGVAVFLATQSVSDLAGSSGADYREFLSNSFFFKTNLNSSAEIRALMPTSEQQVRRVTDLISGLQPGQMLFSRNLQQNLRESILDAVQFFRRN